MGIIILAFILITRPIDFHGTYEWLSLRLLFKYGLENFAKTTQALSDKFANFW